MVSSILWYRPVRRARSHFRFHQHLGQCAPPPQRFVIRLFEKLVNKHARRATTGWTSAVRVVGQIRGCRMHGAHRYLFSGRGIASVSPQTDTNYCRQRGHRHTRDQCTMDVAGGIRTCERRFIRRVRVPPASVTITCSVMRLRLSTCQRTTEKALSPSLGGRCRRFSGSG
jgi:hypothetical protein